MPGIAGLHRRRLRPCFTALCVVATLIAGGPASTIAHADTVRSAIARFSSNRAAHRSITIGADIYTFGGIDGVGHDSDEVVRYRPSDGSFDVVAHLPFALVGSAPVWTSGNTVYLIGGRNDAVADQVRSIYRFDLATHALTTMSALLPERSSDMAALWDGTFIYVFGGSAHIVDQYGDSGAELDTILRYDPATDTLTTLPAHLPHGWWNLAAVWVGADAFLFGGSSYERTGDDRIVRFSPATGTVTTMAAHLAQSVEETAVVSDGTYAYVVGGIHAFSLPYQISDTVTRYDPAADAVTVLPQHLERPRWWMQAALQDGDIFVLAGVTGGGGITNDIVRYGITTQQVAWMSGLPATTWKHCAISDGTSVWLLGGERSVIYRFDPATRATLVSPATFPAPAFETSCAYDGSAIYVFGGYNSRAIRRFDPATQTATIMNATLPRALSSTQAVWDGEAIYVIGGSESSYNIFRYDPRTDTLRTMQATLPSAVVSSNTTRFIYYENFSALWDGQRIDILGGDQTDKILRYDPVADVVTEAATHFPNDFEGASAVFDGSKIYLLGGYLGNTRVDTVYAYDPIADALTTRAARLPHVRWASAAAIVGGTIWVTGGCCDDNNDRFSDILAYDFRPGAPTEVRASSGPDNGEVTVSWQPPGADSYRSAITGYTVYQATTSGAEIAVATLGGQASSYTVSNIATTTTVFFRVAAITADGAGALSNEVAAPGLGPPGKPAALRASAGPRGKQITLSWDPPSKTGGTNVDLSYRILRSTSAGAETAIASVQHNTLTSIDTGLANGTTYYYKVTAFDGAGESAPSLEASATTGVPTSAARNLQVNMGSAPGRNDLAWLPPTSRGGVFYIEYHIYRGSASGTETYLATVVSDTRFTDTTCSIGTVCYYVVRADNGAGEAPRSNEVFFPGFALPL